MDDTQRRALRKGVDELDHELGALWGEIASSFGEHSRQMQVLYTARKSCDLVTMQRAVDSLAALLRGPARQIEADGVLAKLEARAKMQFGAASLQVARIVAARSRGDADEMRQAAEVARRELAAAAAPPALLRGVHSGDSRQGRGSRPEKAVPRHVLGPAEFSGPENRPPLPTPQRRVDVRAPRRATPTPRPPQPLGLSGVARQCSCGEGIAMPSDYVCYKCKPE